jgi:hypothetical protein
MRGRPHGLIFAIALTLIAGACQKSLPSAPSELAEGLTVYEHDNFRGHSAHVTADIADLEKFDGPCAKHETITLPNGDTVTTSTESWDNCISSVRLAPGWRAILYGDDDYRGGRFEAVGDISDLKTVAGSCEEGFNDCVSSIRVFRP